MAKIAVAPVKAATRVDESFKSPLIKSISFSAKQRLDLELTLRVTPRTLHSGRVENRAATEPP